MLHAWVLTRYSGFFPQSKNITVRLITSLNQLKVAVFMVACPFVALQ